MLVQQKDNQRGLCSSQRYASLASKDCYLHPQAGWRMFRSATDLRLSKPETSLCDWADFATWPGRVSSGIFLIVIAMPYLAAGLISCFSSSYC